MKRTVGMALGLSVAVAACGGPTPTPTPRPSPSPTTTPTPEVVVECGDFPLSACAAAADVVLQDVTDLKLIPVEVRLGAGLRCPVPKLLFEPTLGCIPGATSIPPEAGGEWIGHGVVAFADTDERAYFNVSRSDAIVSATFITLASPPPGRQP